jgi:TRAP-type uncharacterized transport system substrate-binding protein
MSRMDWRTRLKRLPLGGIGLVVATVLIALVLSKINFGSGLGHVDVKMLSGSTGGNYAAVVDRLTARAAKRGGTIENVSSAGSVDNVQRLVAGAADCDVHFALIQDGVPLPDSDRLQLIGRLPQSETLFIIGRDAAKLTKFAEMRGMRIGLGPKGSGTDYLARRVLEADDLKSLGLRLSNHELSEQVERVAAGELELGVFVMDENAQLIRNAVRDRGLQLVSLEQLDVVTTRVPFLSLGTIKAGQYDMLAVVPARAQPVLRVDTLIVGNGCASRSVEIGVLEVLVEELPALSNTEFHGGSLRRSEVAKEFYASEGPGFADEYVPWLVDIMPLGNWFYIAMCLSVLLNAMTLWHKVRLWKVDANRDKAFQIVRDALGETLTPAEIQVLEPTAVHRTRQTRERIDEALRALDALRVKTRKEENSLLVPMGHEWMYRYEEEQMELLLVALRAFRAKVGDA